MPKPRGRPRKKELITKTAFAMKCGLKLSQISMYTGGNDPRLVVDEETGQIDVRNPVNNLFLETYRKKKDRENALDTADSDVRTKLAELMKIEADAKWKAVKARKELGELLDKRIIEDVFLILGKTFRELLLPQGERVSPKICSLFESIDKEKMIQVQEVIDDENGKVLDEIKKVLKEKIRENNFFDVLDDGEIFGG
jgi:hypothetical protein